MAWARRNAKLAVALGLLAALLISGTIWDALSTYRSLPPAQVGWTRLVTLSGTTSRKRSILFHGVQLRICWLVRGNLTGLDYSISAKTVGLYKNTYSSSRSGCLVDSTDDNGPTTVAVAKRGGGSYAVSIDEHLSSKQEIAAQTQEAGEPGAQHIDKDTRDLSAKFVDMQTSISNVQDDMGRIDQDISTAQSDLAAAKQQAHVIVSRVQASGTDRSLCHSAGTIRTDATAIQGDIGSVHSDLRFLKSDLGDLRSDSAELQRAAARAARTARLLPGAHTASIPPSPAAIQSALLSAHEWVRKGQHVLRTRQVVADALATSAKNVAQSTVAAVCA